MNHTIGPTQKPGFLARRFQQIAVAVFHAEVAAAGFDLTPVQYSVLTALVAHPGVDQATLAGLIAFDRTTIGGVVDRLAQRGFVSRRAHPSDRRARALEITAEGADLVARIEPAVQRAQRVMLSGLDTGEAAEFMRLLAKAVDGCNDLSRAPMLAMGEEAARS
ncbi:MarR family transcriptional regulator [Roseiarcus fermentans]|uniref:MarR family transcriptional regulator n=1 Tax=Roseiarcus fermentans TaxID=1473586 RepID=A0A366FSZ7_9HYPH|nr:MarR family transcriptional regulator [Roseiarcus fermentans]RBP17748.1 MarR family transcriptional regulator [Roseiarcus fermentans]